MNLQKRNGFGWNAKILHRTAVKCFVKELREITSVVHAAGFAIVSTRHQLNQDLQRFYHGKPHKRTSPTSCYLPTLYHSYISFYCFSFCFDMRFVLSSQFLWIYTYVYNAKICFYLVKYYVYLVVKILYEMILHK